MTTELTPRDIRGIAYNIRNSIAVDGLPFAHLPKSTLAMYERQGWILQRGQTGYYDVTPAGLALIGRAVS